MLAPPGSGGEAVVLSKMLEPAMSLGTSESCDGCLGKGCTAGCWESPGESGWQQHPEFKALPAPLLEKTLYRAVLRAG